MLSIKKLSTLMAFVIALVSGNAFSSAPTTTELQNACDASPVSCVQSAARKVLAVTQDFNKGLAQSKANGMEKFDYKMTCVDGLQPLTTEQGASKALQFSPKTAYGPMDLCMQKTAKLSSKYGIGMNSGSVASNIKGIIAPTISMLGSPRHMV
jgi:hypothetical protein